MSSFFVDDVKVFDRSTLETWAKCPTQAWLKETSGINSVGELAEIGEQVHQAIGRVVKHYQESGEALPPSEVKEELLSEIRTSRPDLQPEAIDAFRRSAYSFSYFLCEQPFNSIMRYDGGEGDASGQLAYEIKPGFQITSELDLLLATVSPEQLLEVDYKTGHKQWTAEDVKNSFQFQFHAVLVFRNYEEVQSLQVVIWNTRKNIKSYTVEFKRHELQAYESRILKAIEIYEQNQNTLPDSWPTREKCAMCDVSIKCHAVDADLKEVAENPEQFLEETVRLDEIVKARKKQLSAHVDKTGRDVVTQSGDAFGNDKPATSRKPTKSIY